MPSDINPRKSDALPMLASGFKVIADWQLDQYFYTPFTGGVEDSSRRLHLVRNLNRYLSELKTFGLQLDIWIDGSFTTKKPDPEDIDILVLANREDIDNLSPSRAPFLARLTVDKEYVRAKYDIDVYLAYQNEEELIQYYTEKFTKGHATYNSKGFFKVILTHV